MFGRKGVVLIGLGGLLVALAAAWSSTGSSAPSLPCSYNCPTESPTSGAQSANALVDAGLAAQRAGNVNQAFSDYKAAAAKDPNNLYAHYDLGYIYQVRGDTADAATEYRRVLLINPRFGDALYNMGVLEAKTDPASAIAYYTQDLQVDPNNASANFNLGVLLVKQGQTTRGNLYLVTALRLNPALRADLPPGITIPTTTATTKP
jgi:tetratricopeptide (TPR) repeat protein